MTPRAIGISVIVIAVLGTSAVALEAYRRNTLSVRPMNSANANLTVDLAPCLSDPAGQFECLDDIVLSVAETDGVPAALQLLQNQVSNSPAFQTLCHSLTHEVGNFAQQQVHQIGAAFEVAKQDGSVCASGFYHGVIESAVNEIPREKILQQVPEVCQPFADRPQSLDHYNCVHGLGHGLFALRLDDWRAALKDCATLKTTWEQESCASGVFMQNIVNEIAFVGHKSDFRADDPLYPCTATEERWWRPCYVNQSSHVLLVSADNFSAVFDACAGAPESMRRVCYQSAGRDVAGRFRINNQTVVDQCSLAGADGTKDCIIGAVRDYVYYERGPNAARVLCGLVPADVTEVCNLTIENDLKSL